MPRTFLPASAPSFWVVLLVLLMTAAPGVALAAAYEGFDYPVNSTPDTWTGGTGFAAGWRRPMTGFTRARAGSLTDPTGTLLTGGNRVEGEGPYSIARSLGDRPGVAGGEFWVSFLMRRSQAAVGYSGLLIEQSGGGPFSYFIGETGSGLWGESIVISNGNDPDAVSTGVPLEPGRNYFLVARVDLRDGNDPATLWVNPVPGVEPTSGGFTFSLSDLGTGFPSLQFISTTDPPTSFDELRTGTSYAEVAPLVPEPSAATFVALAAPLLALRRRPRAARR